MKLKMYMKIIQEVPQDKRAPAILLFLFIFFPPSFMLDPFFFPNLHGLQGFLLMWGQFGEAPSQDSGSQGSGADVMHCTIFSLAPLTPPSFLVTSVEHEPSSQACKRVFSPRADITSQSFNFLPPHPLNTSTAATNSKEGESDPVRFY